MKLNVKLIHPESKIPVFATPWAAGMDLFACENTVIPPRETKLIRTGISVSWEGENASMYYLRIAPRSGLALKKGIWVNAGVIDYDYRGEIMIVLYNSGATFFSIHPGDRIAQMILTRIHRPTVECGHVSENTERGSGGFGSTG